MAHHTELSSPRSGSPPTLATLLVDDTQLRCPECSCDCLHLVAVEVFQGTVSCAASRDEIKVWSHAVPDNRRGCYVGIAIKCEECAGVFHFALQQHKASIFIDILRVGNDAATPMTYEEAPEMWRD